MPLQAVQLSLIYNSTPYKRRESKRVVGKTINSPLLTHKIAISLSLMRIYVLYFSDVYHCPNLKLTHKSALKSRLLKFINFSLKRFVICLFRRRYGSWPHLVNLPVCLYCCELSYTFFYEEILVYPFLSQAR